MPLWMIKNWKIGIGAAALIVLVFSIRWYGNSCRSEGRVQGREQATEEMAKAKIKEWNSIEKEISKAREEIEAEKLILAQIGEELIQERTLYRESLSRVERNAHDDKVSGYSKSIIVPAENIWHEIRQISRELEGR